MRTSVRARELRLLWRDLPADVLAPRLAALVFVLGGSAALVAGLLGGAPGGITTIAAVAIAFGLGAVVAPWHRYDTRAELLLPLFAFVLFAWAGSVAGGRPEPYLAILALPFVLVGLDQGPGTATALAPLALLSLFVADHFRFDATSTSTAVVALPALALVGETLAFAQARRSRAEAHVERLLEAVRILARVDDLRAGAGIVASLTAELLGADAVAVLVSDREGSSRLLNRAFFGHPALAEATPLLVDALVGRAPSAHATRFVADPRRVRALAPAARCVRAAATIPLPGADDVPVGVVIAMWTTPRRRLQPSARQAAELVSAEAGRMFVRLRTSAALAREAETDALTELANRRTFARALATMQPGDALVLVDLDHFKQVNDRHGHQVGDDTLRLLARTLRETARQVDCVARYGGEEFALVLPEAEIEGALALLARVRRTWESRRPVTTFSAGVARHDAGRSPSATLRLADRALYAAKDAGRDRDMVAGRSGVEVVLG